jgi:hypothetical protein
VAAEPEPVAPPVEPPPAPPVPPKPPAPAAAIEHEPWLDEPDEVPAGDALDHRSPRTSQPTTEFTPEEAAAARGEPVPAEGEKPAEDVLEETPEFLQETPEHERLWFEQKPPRDFDF